MQMWGYDESLYLKRLLCPAGQSVKPTALQAVVPSSTLGQDTSAPGCTARNKCNPPLTLIRTTLPPARNLPHG